MAVDTNIPGERPTIPAAGTNGAPYSVPQTPAQTPTVARTFGTPTPANRRSIGVDLGYGFVKALDSGIEITFPSVVGMGKEIKFFSGMINKDVKVDNLNIIFEGQRYFVGDLAMRQSDIASRGLSQDRVNDKNYKILLLTILSLLAKGDEEIHSVVTGLPTNFFGAYRDEVSQGILGKYEIQIGPKGQEKTKKITLKDAYIIPQPFGTLYDQILGNTGETIFKDYNSQVVGIVDIGFKTSDFAVSNQLEYIDHLSFSTNTALSDAYNIISDTLRNDYKIDKENFELDKIISEGVLKVAGTPHDIKEMKNRTFQFIASKIVTELESQWNYRDFDAILLAGGGGKALAEFILPHFPNMKLVEDPQHANVRGFQKIANKVFKN